MLPIALMFTGGLKLPSITCTYIPTPKSGVETLREPPQEADSHRASKFFGFSALGSYFLVLWFLFIRSFGFGLMALTHLSVIVVAPHMFYMLNNGNFLKWLPCHFLVMVFWLLWAIYQDY